MASISNAAIWLDGAVNSEKGFKQSGLFFLHSQTLEQPLVWMWTWQACQNTHEKPQENPFFINKIKRPQLEQTLTFPPATYLQVSRYPKHLKQPKAGPKLAFSFVKCSLSFAICIQKLIHKLNFIFNYSW